MTITRRQFVQGAATGATLAALGSLSEATAQQQDAQAAAAKASANDTLVVGVMGVNGRGNSLARSFAARKDVAGWQQPDGSFPLRGWVRGGGGVETEAYSTAFGALLLGVPEARLSICNRTPPKLPKP